MKVITRSYLKDLIEVKGTPDIKIITGVRRSWKSQLLQSFQEYLEETEPATNIIAINFNLLEFDELQDYHKLHEYVQSHYQEWKKNVVLIDEIQLCDNFELAINSLHAHEKYDIYLTGSNAFLLSSDLATLFTGRFFEIKIYPFSFKEFIEYYEYQDIHEAFKNYVFEWGMPWSYVYESEEKKYQYITEVYETLIVKDIIQRYKVKDVHLLENLCNYLMDSISNITTSRNITNYLNSNGENCNHVTISAYLNHLCKAFLFYKIKRYDIQWKNYLATQDKYYLVDHSFKYATLGKKNINLWRVYENIVAIELLRRWYKVYIWTMYAKEIDFVAMKQHEKIYIQVSSNIEDETTFQREVTPLLEIRDAYPKILLANTNQDPYTYEWIQIIDIAQWLLGTP